MKTVETPPPITDQVSSPSTSSVSPGVAAAYGSGAVAGQVAEHAIIYLANPVYCVMLGVSPVLVGNTFALTRVIDAVFEPWLGNLSDNARWRHGRRRPLVFIGGVLIALAMAALFGLPRGLSIATCGAVFAGGVTLFYIGYAFFTVGYNALLAELTELPRERARVLGIQTTIRTLVVFATVWALPFAQSNFFGDPLDGIHRYAWFLGLLTLLGTLLVCRFVRERAPDPVAERTKISFRESALQSLRLYPAYPLIATQILMGMSAYLTNSLGYFLLVYYVCRGDQKAGAFWMASIGSVWLGSTLILTTPLVRFVNWFGRERSFQLLGVVKIVAAAATPFCFFPGATWTVCIPTLLIAPSWTVICIILATQSFDLIEWDEWHGGRRRVGMAVWFMGPVNKAVMALTFSAASYLLVFAGFELPRGVNQAPEVFRNMLWGMTLIPITCVVLALIAVRFFPITEAKAREIREKLHARRAAQAAVDVSPASL